MTPIKATKGKKGKKKKAKIEAQIYTDDQDANEEESKNAIVEASDEEEATGEDHNL